MYFQSEEDRKQALLRAQQQALLQQQQQASFMKQQLQQQQFLVQQQAVTQTQQLSHLQHNLQKALQQQRESEQQLYNQFAIPVQSKMPTVQQIPTFVAPQRPKLITYTFNGIKFELPTRYTNPSPIGHGSFGVVVSAYDNFTQHKVAIKKISQAFENVAETKRILREIKLLRHFDHDNIIAIKDILPPPPNTTDIYIVTELMDANLQQIILSKQLLTDDHIQYFIYQLLRGLKAIHSAHVLHRDIKPSNLLVNRDCDLKICDFGLARVANPDDTWNLFLTEYVATRWYRAPEVILSWKQYSKAIDIWSAGCIFAELLGGKPLFQGKDYINQIQKIIEIVGSPMQDEIANIKSEPARNFIKQIGPKLRTPFSSLYPHANPKALDLLEQMLSFDPNKRMSAAEALEHPYFEGLHEPDAAPISPVAIFSFDWENIDLSKEMLQELVWKEILAFHPEADPNYGNSSKIAL